MNSTPSHVDVTNTADLELDTLADQPRALLSSAPLERNESFRVYPSTSTFFSVSGLSFVFLCITTPMCVLMYVLGQASTFIFLLCMLTLGPAARLLCDFNDQLSSEAGEGFAGSSAVLSVSLVNISEFIFGVMALQEGQIRMLKSSFVGSVWCNLLGVLGVSILTSTWNPKTESLSSLYFLLKTSIGMLLVSTLCLALPSLIPKLTNANTLASSRWLAFIDISVYLIYCYAHLRSASFRIVPWRNIIGMLVALGFMTILTYIMTNTLDKVSQSWGTTQRAVSTLLVPFASNMAELALSLRGVQRGNLGFAVSISIGSALQMLLLVLPLLILLGIPMNVPIDLTLQPFSVLVMLLSILLARNVLMAPKQIVHWLSGWVALATYVMVALTYLWVPEGI